MIKHSMTAEKLLDLLATAFGGLSQVDYGTIGRALGGLRNNGGMAHEQVVSTIADIIKLEEERWEDMTEADLKEAQAEIVAEYENICIRRHIS